MSIYAVPSICCALGILYFAFQSIFIGSKVPGPRQLPFLGNAHQVPRREFARKLCRFNDLYGPICLLSIFGRKIILLSSVKAATDLFNKRKYTDRPVMPMVELVGRHHSVVFQKQSERLYKYRKMLHQVLSERAVAEYTTLQESESRKFMRRLLESPKDFIEHTEMYPASVILRISFGYSVRGKGDELLQLAAEVREITTLASRPGQWLVDSFPSLALLPRWLPGMGFRTWAEKSRKLCQDHLKYPIESVKKQMREGTAVDSFAKSLLEAYPNATPTSELEEDMIRNVCASLFAGGTDTSFGLIMTFMLYMALYPEVQLRAQEEVDQVIGTERPPRVADRERLPFVDCIIQELHRMSPPVPVVPRRAMEDDVYEGYNIQKGTGVYTNLWAICRDPSVYPEPQKFNPSRFESNAKEDRAAQPDPREFTFGFGGRLCPGRHIAHSGIFIAVAHLLWAFTIAPVVDADGHPHPPVEDFTFGHINRPKDFQCRFLPRSKDIVNTLERSDI